MSIFSKLFNKLRRVDSSESTEPARKDPLTKASRKDLAQVRKEHAQRLFRNKHLTPKQIANELGVARSTVYMYLEGVRSVNTRSDTTS